MNWGPTKTINLSLGRVQTASQAYYEMKKIGLPEPEETYTKDYKEWFIHQRIDSEMQIFM